MKPSSKHSSPITANVTEADLARIRGGFGGQDIGNSLVGRLGGEDVGGAFTSTREGATGSQIDGRTAELLPGQP